MPGVPPDALSQLKSRFKGLLKKSKKDDKPTETTKPAAAAPGEATKTTDAPPATTQAVAETRVEEPIIAREGETAMAKEETTTEPATAVVADPEPGAAPTAVAA